MYPHLPDRDFLEKGIVVNSEFFLAGCIGAIAPEILRLYQMRLARKRIRFGKFYYGISLAYVLLGGYVAAIFPGISGPFWAMCIGVGLVTTVNAMGKAAGVLNTRMKAGLEGDVAHHIRRIGGAPDMREFSDTGRVDKSGNGETVARRGTFWDFVRML